MEIAERDEVNIFEIFCKKLKDKWDAEVRRGRASLLVRKDYFYEEETYGIVIYEQNRMTIKAIFEPDRSWIDDPHLYNELKEMLPDFVPFFKNEKKLLQEKDWLSVNVE